jgi:signal transduction histidine kinase
VAADSDLLDLAIMNLLENSVKYSNPPAQIEMTLEQIGSEAQLSVIDKGIGIPQPDLAHIFERFYTVDKARSRKSGGAGLGLSIVKTIVEKHKGNFKVYSEIGQGSTFTLSFPICCPFEPSKRVSTN